LLDAIAGGELHLTGLLMLGPHLTEANHLEVMAHAKFRTKKEIGKLVRTLAPLPQVPDRIEPLGPEPRKAPRNPTCEEFAASLCPVVRELPPGERPCDWANDKFGQCETEPASAESPRTEDGPVPAPARVDAAAPVDRPARVDVGVDADQPPPLTGPQLYQMQFTTTEEHAQLIERARALLSHGSARASLGELHVQAMRLLVAALEKQRLGAGVRARKPSRSLTRESADSPAPEQAPGEHPRQRGDDGPTHSTGHPRQRGERDSQGGRVTTPRGPTRYIPAAERRAVFERDGGRCTYVDNRGQRCPETHLLQFHHLQAFAKGGANEAANLALRCAAHNSLAAEEDFGRDQTTRARDSCQHESRKQCEQSARLAEG
jgi:5-methylcytosine-specific restriction endonuclease McrA